MTMTDTEPQHPGAKHVSCVEVNILSLIQARGVFSAFIA